MNISAAIATAGYIHSIFFWKLRIPVLAAIHRSRIENPIVTLPATETSNRREAA